MIDSQASAKRRKEWIIAGVMIAIIVPGLFIGLAAVPTGEERIARERAANEANGSRSQQAEARAERETPATILTDDEVVIDWFEGESSTYGLVTSYMTDTANAASRGDYSAAADHAMDAAWQFDYLARSVGEVDGGLYGRTLEDTFTTCANAYLATHDALKAMDVVAIQAVTPRVSNCTDSLNDVAARLAGL